MLDDIRGNTKLEVPVPGTLIKDCSGLLWSLAYPSIPCRISLRGTGDERHRVNRDALGLEEPAKGGVIGL